MSEQSNAVKRVQAKALLALQTEFEQEHIHINSHKDQNGQYYYDWVALEFSKWYEAKHMVHPAYRKCMRSFIDLFYMTKNMKFESQAKLLDEALVYCAHAERAQFQVEHPDLTFMSAGDIYLDPKTLDAWNKWRVKSHAKKELIALLGDLAKLVNSLKTNGEVMSNDEGQKLQQEQMQGLMGALPKRVTIPIESELMARFESEHDMPFTKSSEAHYTDLCTAYAYQEWYKKIQHSLEIEALNKRMDEIQMMMANNIAAVDKCIQSVASTTQWHPYLYTERDWTEADEEIRKEKRRGKASVADNRDEHLAIKAQVKRIVVCSANKYRGVMLIGVRHWDNLMHAQSCRLSPEFLKEARDEWKQGFIDQWGHFMNRKEAFIVASAAGQIKVKTGNPDSIELFSEDFL